MWCGEIKFGSLACYGQYCIKINRSITSHINQERGAALVNSIVSFARENSSINFCVCC